MATIVISVKNADIVRWCMVLARMLHVVLFICVRGNGVIERVEQLTPHTHTHGILCFTRGSLCMRKCNMLFTGISDQIIKPSISQRTASQTDSQIHTTPPTHTHTDCSVHNFTITLSIWLRPTCESAPLAAGRRGTLSMHHQSSFTACDSG